MTKHVLFILTSAAYVGTGGVSTGYEFSEVADPYFEFRKAGFTVDFASPAGGSPPESSYDPTNNISKAFRESNDFLRLTFSHKLAGINVKAYDAIFFPGGLGPMVDLAGEPLVKEIIRQVYEGETLPPVMNTKDLVPAGTFHDRESTPPDDDPPSE